MELNEIAQIYKNVSGVIYSTLETQKHSYDCGREVILKNIEGDIIELGIASGGNFASMMLGMKSVGGNRTCWGFDSFQGIQLAGKKDTVQAGIGAITHNVNVPEEQLLVSSGITVHPKQQVIENLKRWKCYDNVKLVEGWVQNTLPVELPNIDKISILRLDMDIYDPTKIALNLLYDKISVGGIIIIDDWALDGVRIACNEFFEERGLNVEMLSIKNSTPKYFYKK